jgi:tRNA A-37 threonylcarbamoyl transferase component Bud32
MRRIENRMNRSLVETVRVLSGRRDVCFGTFHGFHPNSTVMNLVDLPSKKNKVFRIETDGGNVVLKVFRTGKAQWEFSVLEKALSRGLMVPEPYILVENLMLLEFIEGRTVSELLDQSLDSEYIVGVAKWFAKFHESFRKGELTLIKSDSNLKNFLVSEYGVVGVDFELARIGNPIEDLGEACAYLLDTDPMFTAKKYELCRVFLRTYQEATGSRLVGMSQSIASALKEAARFRKNQRDTLLLKAAEISKTRVF